MLYGATRSTGQIEEGAPGHAIATVRGGVTSWHFRPIGELWPMVRTLAPADLRLVTRPADPRQVPRPGDVTVVVHVMGQVDAPVCLSINGGAGVAMAATGGYWTATIPLVPSLNHLTVKCGDTRDAVEVLVRPVDTLPKRPPPTALGRDIHAIGAWHDLGIFGTRLGPSRNGGAS